MVRHIIQKGKKLISSVLIISISAISLWNGQTIKVQAAEDEWDFEYNGSTQSWTAPKSGKYYLEVVGAGSEPAGYGGKLTGYINITQGTTYYITVGGAGGRNMPAGFNGGGEAYYGAGSGGGATSITTGIDMGVLANYKDYKHYVVAVAGGAGGVPSCHGNIPNVDYNQWQHPEENQTNGGGANSAPMLESGRFSLHANRPNENDSAQPGSNVSGYAFGQGQNAIHNSTASSGAGGGGYFGGCAPLSFLTLGGAGGGGYYKDLYDITSSNSGSTGNGYVKIKYMGNIEVAITIDPSTGGTINGSSNPITIKANFNDVVNLPSLQVKNGYTFEGWEKTENNVTTDFNDPSITAGTSSINLIAKYIAPLKFVINQSDIDNSLSMQLEQDDKHVKQYRIYQSYDGVNWELANSNTDIPWKEKTFTFGFENRAQEFTLTPGKIWRLEAYGAAGGYPSSESWANDRVGGEGGKAIGEISVQSDLKIYFHTGGKGERRHQVTDNSSLDWVTRYKGTGGKGGYNGGGNGGQYNGLGGAGGGGATHIAITNRDVLRNYEYYKDELLLVAGGGGGCMDGESSGGGVEGGSARGGGKGGTQYGGGGTEAQSFGGSYSQSGFGYGSDAWYGNDGGGGGYYGGGAGIGTVYGGGGGGSGYINKNRIKDIELSNSGNRGDGYVKIISKEQSITKNVLHNIEFKDTMAPNLPSDGDDYTKNGTKYVSWKNNGDNGRTIYHYAESIDTDGTLLNKTEAQSNYVESGVSGWYYYIDTQPTGEATSNHQFTSVPEVSITGQTRVTYMHIACIDRAGNLSGTYNYKIEPSYTIKYDNNGGVGEPIYDQALFGEEYTIIDTKPFTKTGYNFIGWGLDNTTTVTHQPSDKFTITEITENKVVTLYAIWEPITYTVNIYQNAPNDYTSHGHSVNVPNTVTDKTKNQAFDTKYGNSWKYVTTNGKPHWTRTFVYDATVLNNTTEFYTVTGWHTDNNQMWTIGGSNGGVSGTAYPSDQTNRWNLTTVDKSTINLYPKWEKNTYYIDYSGNDTRYNIYDDEVTTKYTGTVDSTECKYDTNVTLAINKFTKPGYTFKEWNTKSDGTGTGYKSGETLTKPDFTAVENGRVTLYAIWEPKIYTVVFHPDKGQITDWDETYEKYKIDVRFDSIKEIYVPNAYQFAHEFGGWAKTRQFDIKEDGTFPKLDSSNFFTVGKQKISVSNDEALKKSAGAKIHFNPFNETLGLWTWFNRKPVFVDIYEGLFFEGQQVTYNDALELVRSWDYEDNYLAVMKTSIEDFFNTKITKIDQDIQTDEDKREYLIAERDVLIYSRDELISSLSELSEEEITEEDKEKLDDLDAQIELLSVQESNLIDHLHELFEQKEQYEQDLETQLQALPDRAQLLQLQIAEIHYLTPNITFNYRTNEVSTNGINIAAENGKVFNSRLINYNTMFVKTGSKFIGDFDITYQVHDKGITYTDKNGNTEYIPDTDVTMEYTRRCKVNYNYNPLIYTQGSVQYSSDALSAIEIAKLQAVFDSEDTEDNIPWWSRKDTRNENTNNSLLLHPDRDKETLQELQDNLVITGVNNIKFNSSFTYEYPEAVKKFNTEFSSPELDNNVPSGCETGKYYYVRGLGVRPVYNKISILNTINGFRNSNDIYYEEIRNGEKVTVTKAEVYKAIISIDITFDSVDQWGKWASGRVSKEIYERDNTKDDTPGNVDPDDKPDGLTPDNNGGYEWPDIPGNKPWDDPVTQDEDERTTTVVIINTDTDSWLVDNEIINGYIRDNVRYIDSNWLGKGLRDSYWGDYGRKTLEDILNKNSSAEVNQEHNGEYKNTIEKDVDINIKDYTK